MDTGYPIRKSDGDDFSSDDELLKLLGKEPHGQWLAGNNSMWHGGIHVSASSVPWSVIVPNKIDNAVPLQCMADGEVVAWRLNKDYMEGQYGEKTLQYSSVFLLVRSVHKPAADNKTWLTFYTLYMHLAPLSSHPKLSLYKVTDKGNNVRMRRNTGAEKSGQVAPEVMIGNVLKTGDRVIVEQKANFIVKGKKDEPNTNEPFGLMKIVTKGKQTVNAFWASLRPEYMLPDGDDYAYLPPWMTAAIDMGGDDGSVFKPEKPFAIKAGDAVGFLARDDAPGSDGSIVMNDFTHIEVFSNDPNMPQFLNNPGKLQTGKKYIVIKDEQPLYHCEEIGKIRTFQPMGVMTKAICGKIVTEPARYQDEQKTWWFEALPHTWIKEDGVEQLTQHDLAGLKFTALDQQAVKDIQKSLDEKWVSDAFHFLSKEIPAARDLECEQLSNYYSQMYEILEQNRRGALSAEEMKMYRGGVLPGLRHKHKDTNMLLRRLVVKHESEWHGKKDHPRWQGMLNELSDDAKKYAGQYIDDHEWMSQYPDLSKDEPVWHFHPIEFLSALIPVQDCAQLIWGEIVNEIHGKEKGCKFRKKVVGICAELWGEAQKKEYADVLMGCISVETNRKFMSSVAAYRKVKNRSGDIVYVNGENGPRPKIEYHVYTSEEINADPSLASKNGVGLIQFTSKAVEQINQKHGLSLTKKQLALMDEIEQLDYVKLYFTANESLFELIKTPEDVYTFIFCPKGVGKPNDAILYSKDATPEYYFKNRSLDSSEDGNHGNNDDVIQKSELLSRLDDLINEGKRFRNRCECVSENAARAPWMTFAFGEYSKYKNNIETDEVLNERIKQYHNTTNQRGKDWVVSWCSSFVNWSILQTSYADKATNSAVAYSWKKNSWANGEQVDKPFYGAIVIMDYSHVGFVYGKNSRGNILILGGNQGGGRIGKSNCISIRSNSLSSVVAFMKPKGYVIPPEDYELQVVDITGPDMTYSDTH